MSIKNRILSVYRNQLPDKLPFAMYNTYHRPGTVERHARNSGMGILEFYPVVSLLAPPWLLWPGYMSEVKNSNFNINYSWDNGRLIEVRTIETPVGKLSTHIRKDSSYGSSWVEQPYIKSTEDYKIMQYIVENTVFTYQGKMIKQKMKDMGDDGVILGRIDRAPYQKLIVELTKPENFFIDLFTNPGPIEELIQAMAFREEEQLEMALNSEVQVIWQVDNITSDMTPPDMFEKYNLPIYRRNGEKIKEAGKVYAVHFDGKILALADQINETRIDVIDSFSMPVMGGDVEIEEALKLWPDKVLCPNFPTSLCSADEKEIINYIGEMYRSFGGKPFMIQLSEDFDIELYDHILNTFSKIDFTEFDK
jgi:hypothetical protein